MKPLLKPYKISFFVRLKKEPKASIMFSNISQTIENISKNSISNERKLIVQPLIDYIQEKVTKNQTIRLNFICTHNSRRSHLGQIWAQTMAFHFKVKNVFCFSGGTETTAMFPKIVETIEKQGFQIQILSENTNPVYAVKFTENEPPIICFSKTFDAFYNPKKEFAAILTCSSADKDCPFIAGADVRIPIQYNDPKAFDNTELMTEKYNERSLEIATEMYYVFSKINH